MWIYVGLKLTNLKTYELKNSKTQELKNLRTYVKGNQTNADKFPVETADGPAGRTGGHTGGRRRTERWLDLRGGGGFQAQPQYGPVKWPPDGDIFLETSKKTEKCLAVTE